MLRKASREVMACNSRMSGNGNRESPRLKPAWLPMLFFVVIFLENSHSSARTPICSRHHYIKIQWWQEVERSSSQTYCSVSSDKVFLSVDTHSLEDSYEMGAQFQRAFSYLLIGGCSMMVNILAFSIVY